MANRWQKRQGWQGCWLNSTFQRIVRPSSKDCFVMGWRRNRPKRWGGAFFACVSQTFFVRKVGCSNSRRRHLKIQRLVKGQLIRTRRILTRFNQRWSTQWSPFEGEAAGSGSGDRNNFYATGLQRSRGGFSSGRSNPYQGRASHNFNGRGGYVHSSFDSVFPVSPMGELWQFTCMAFGLASAP